MADKARRQILRLLRAEEIPLEGNDGDQTVLDRDVRLDQTAAIYTAALDGVETARYFAGLQADELIDILCEA